MSADFPDVWRQTVGEHVIELPLTYRYAPGEPLDGVTVHVPLPALNQVHVAGFDWQIAGHRAELVTSLVRSLPKATRRQLIPLGDTIDAVVERDRRRCPATHRPADSSTRWPLSVTAVSGVFGGPVAFDTPRCPSTCGLHFVVSDDEGTVHTVGTDLDSLRAGLAGSVRDSIAAGSADRGAAGHRRLGPRRPPTVSSNRADRALDVHAYPTLLDVGESGGAARGDDARTAARRSMRGGVRRLLLLKRARRHVRPSSADWPTTNGWRSPPDRSGPRRSSADCVAAAIDRVMSDHGALPWTRGEFDELRRLVGDSAPGLAGGTV